MFITINKCQVEYVSLRTSLTHHESSSCRWQPRKDGIVFS